MIAWHEFHQDVHELAEMLAELPAFDCIVAVSRGGLVPAAIVATALDIRVIDTICIASYEERNRGEAKIFKAPQLETKPARILVIDDLVDTGKTMVLVRELLPSAYCAAVYAKPLGIPSLDLFSKQYPQDLWIDLPWEQKRRPSARKRGRN